MVILLALVASSVWYITDKYQTYKSQAVHYKDLDAQNKKKIDELNTAIDNKEKTISNLKSEIQIVTESIGSYTKLIDNANTAMQKLVDDKSKKEKELAKLKKEFFAKNPTLVDDKQTIDSFEKLSSEIRIGIIHDQYCVVSGKCDK